MGGRVGASGDAGGSRREGGSSPPPATPWLRESAQILRLYVRSPSGEGGGEESGNMSSCRLPHKCTHWTHTCMYIRVYVHVKSVRMYMYIM